MDDAGNGVGITGSKPAYLQATPRAQILSILTEITGHYSSQSSVVCKHQLPAYSKRAHVYGGYYGLALQKVLSWRKSNTMKEGYCVEAQQEAIGKNGKPVIFNTDQGSQFSDESWIEALKKTPYPNQHGWQSQSY